MKVILHYSDSSCDHRIIQASLHTLQQTGLPVIMVLLLPKYHQDRVLLRYGLHTMIWLPLQRGYLTMFRQILAGLEEAPEGATIFLTEHDVLYHHSHFDFEPPDRNAYWYNENVVTLRTADAYCVQYSRRSTLGLCADRDLLLAHYRERVHRLEAFDPHVAATDPGGESFRAYVYRMGFEPGCCSRAERVDDVAAHAWRSEYPNVDLKHGKNLTVPQWTPADFKNPKWCRDWHEVTRVEGWGSPRNILYSIGVAH